MNPDERAQFIRTGLARLRQAQDVARRIRPGLGPLHDVLRERTPIALVTPVLVAANVIVFAGLLFGTGDASDPTTLISWGANFGPHTTNGEWWRLLTASFVHSSLLHLAVNLAALISVGLVLERLIGHLTFAAVYSAAAAFAGVASLSASSVAVTAGGSGAIFGLYGLLLASWGWGAFQHATTTIRLQTVKRLAPAALAFVLYNVADDSIAGAAARIGLVIGFVCGLVLARCVRDRKPPAGRIAGTVAVTASIAFVLSVPLRGMIDVRPELAQLVSLEDRLARTYDAAVKDFTTGRVTRQALAATIESAVLPELQGPRQRLSGLDRVPPEHRAMVTAAETYLRLREKGWRLRATGLRKSSTSMLREADAVERDALVAFQTIRR